MLKINEKIIVPIFNPGKNITLLNLPARIVFNKFEIENATPIPIAENTLFLVQSFSLPPFANNEKTAENNTARQKAKTRKAPFCSLYNEF